MRYLTLGLLLVFGSLKQLSAQELKQVTQDQVLAMLNETPDSGYIVFNFWATWCPPCIDELPYFIKADTTLRGENYTFVFVSLDPERTFKSTARYIKKLGIPGTHYLMQQDSVAQFLNSVDPNLQGAIPFTVLVSNTGRKTHEGAFNTFKELWNFIRFD